MSHIRQSIDRFEQGIPVLPQMAAGLTKDELNAFPVPGTWSIQQVIQHTLESDLIATHRMKRIIAEENPLLIGYDETLFAQKLPYASMSVQQACDLFRLNREQMIHILRTLPEAAFSRSGVHNQRGKVTLLQLVDDYADHPFHHLKFVKEKRAKLGKPM